MHAQFDMVTIDPASVPDRGMYHLLNSTIAPRPVAWVSSMAADGTLNLAPHSYTTVFSPDPPIIGFVSIGQKDTLRNCRERGEFVYNIGSTKLVEVMNLSAANFPPEISEFDWTGLTPTASGRIAPPRVGECAVSYECKVAAIHQVAESNNFLIMGEIVLAHIDESVMVDGRVDFTLLDPVTRLAGSQYSRPGEVYSVKRPTYKSLLEEGREPVKR